MIAIAGGGLLVSLLMEGLPLHTEKDENYAIKDNVKDVEHSR